MTRILESVPDVAVVASVADPGDLPGDATGWGFDLLILDLYLTEGRPALDTVASFAQVLPVLVMSASREPVDVLRAMQAGASGYLSKNASEAAYLSAIRSVRSGAFYLSAELADLIEDALDAGDLPPPSTGEPIDLSPRERETLSFIARGFTHQQTATRMGVSVATVNTYVTRIRTKLSLGNKAELALAALRYLRPGTSTGA